MLAAMNSKCLYRSVFRSFAPVLLIAALLMANACTKQRGYQTDVTIRGDSLLRFTNNFDVQISSTKQFLASFIDSYRWRVMELAQNDFHGDFLFLGTNISTRVFFSDVAETFLYLYPSPSNSLTAQCTRYPVQMALFSGLDTDDPAVGLKAPEADALKLYDAYPGFFYATNSWGFLQDFTFVSKWPKLLKLSDDSIFGITKVTILVTNAPGSRTAEVDTLGILTGGRDFRWCLPIAPELGKAFAERQVMNLFVSSEIFRASLAHPKLKPIADEISERRKRQNELKEEYPYWKFLLDKNRLITEANKYGLGDSYVEGMLSSRQALESGGALLWSFESLRGYILQWALVNIFLLAVSLVIHWRWPKRGKPKRILVFSTGGLLTISLGINAWILKTKPPSVGLLDGIVPWVLLACLVLPVGWRLFKLKGQGEFKT